MSRKATKADIAQARETLSNLKPGMTLHTQLLHVSRSGMSRRISVKLIEPGRAGSGEARIYCYDWAASVLVNGRSLTSGDPEGVIMGGCGMDTGFALVCALSYKLFPDGFQCVGDGCPASDHSNPPYPPRVKGSMHHRNGGYALIHRWM